MKYESQWKNIGPKVGSKYWHDYAIHFILSIGIIYVLTNRIYIKALQTYCHTKDCHSTRNHRVDKRWSCPLAKNHSHSSMSIRFHGTPQLLPNRLPQCRSHYLAMERHMVVDLYQFLSKRTRNRTILYNLNYLYEWLAEWPFS